MVWNLIDIEQSVSMRTCRVVRGSHLLPRLHAVSNVLSKEFPYPLSALTPPEFQVPTPMPSCPHQPYLGLVKRKKVRNNEKD